MPRFRRPSTCVGCEFRKASSSARFRPPATLAARDLRRSSTQEEGVLEAEKELEVMAATGKLECALEKQD